MQKEFSCLADDSNIYKLVGPVLLKQERGDAKVAVDGRLEFIGKDIASREKRVKELQEGSEKRRQEVMILQQKMQLGQQGGAQAASKG